MIGDRLFSEEQGGVHVDISGDADTPWFQDFLASAPARPQPVEVDLDRNAMLMHILGRNA